MPLYVAHLHSPIIGRAGQWFTAEEEGDLLFPVKLRTEGGKLFIQRTSTIGWPFHILADYIIEPGAVARRSDRSRLGSKGELSAQTAQKLINAFQAENAEEIEEVEKEREKDRNPTMGGVFVPGDPPSE